MNNLKTIKSTNDLKNEDEIDVIYIDDNINDAMLFDNSLKSLGEKYRCYWIQNASTFLEIVEDKSIRIPKLIIMDLNMPGINGLECKKTLNEDSYYSKIPTIMLSSSREDVDISSAYKINFNGYLVKDASILTFRKQIKYTLKYWIDLNQSQRLA